MLRPHTDFSEHLFICTSGSILIRRWGCVICETLCPVILLIFLNTAQGSSKLDYSGMALIDPCLWFPFSLQICHTPATATPIKTQTYSPANHRNREWFHVVFWESPEPILWSHSHVFYLASCPFSTYHCAPRMICKCPLPLSDPKSCQIFTFSHLNSPGKPLPPRSSCLPGSLSFSPCVLVLQRQLSKDNSVISLFQSLWAGDFVKCDRNR